MGFQAAEECFFFTGFVQQVFQLGDVEAAPQHQCGQCGFARFLLRMGQDSGDFLIMAQGGEGGFCGFAAVLAAEFGMGAEIGGEDAVGGLGEGEDLGEDGGCVLELDWGHMAGWDVGWGIRRVFFRLPLRGQPEWGFCIYSRLK